MLINYITCEDSYANTFIWQFLWHNIFILQYIPNFHDFKIKN